MATSRSLLLIDEFGKGTDTSDGVGLFVGVIRHLMSREERPKVLAATHFHECFSRLGGSTPLPLDEDAERLGVGYGHMRILLPEPREGMPVGDEEIITYLYKLEPGRSLASFGTA